MPSYGMSSTCVAGIATMMLLALVSTALPVHGAVAVVADSAEDIAPNAEPVAITTLVLEEIVFTKALSALVPLLDSVFADLTAVHPVLNETVPVIGWVAIGPLEIKTLNVADVDFQLQAPKQATAMMTNLSIRIDAAVNLPNCNGTLSFISKASPTLNYEIRRNPTTDPKAGKDHLEFFMVSQSAGIDEFDADFAKDVDKSFTCILVDSTLNTTLTKVNKDAAGIVLGSLDALFANVSLPLPLAAEPVATQRQLSLQLNLLANPPSSVALASFDRKAPHLFGSRFPMMTDAQRQQQQRREGREERRTVAQAAGAGTLPVRDVREYTSEKSINTLFAVAAAAGKFDQTQSAGSTTTELGKLYPKAQELCSNCPIESVTAVTVAPVVSFENTKIAINLPTSTTTFYAIPAAKGAKRVELFALGVSLATGFNDVHVPQPGASTINFQVMNTTTFGVTLLSTNIGAIDTAAVAANLNFEVDDIVIPALNAITSLPQLILGFIEEVLGLNINFFAVNFNHACDIGVDVEFRGA